MIYFKIINEKFVNEQDYELAYGCKLKDKYIIYFYNTTKEILIYDTFEEIEKKHCNENLSLVYYAPCPFEKNT
jgi:hypothetical protein